MDWLAVRAWMVVVARVPGGVAPAAGVAPTEGVAVAAAGPPDRRHLLTPTQALGYVRARYSLGDGSDIERIGRQQAFMSSLISRVKSELLNPLAVYRFLYNLGESLRGIPSSKIAFFTIPNFPRGEVVPGDTANILWTQPEAGEIFASFRDDVPAPGLFSSHAPAKTAGRAPPSAQPTSIAAAQAAGHALLAGAAASAGR